MKTSKNNVMSEIVNGNSRISCIQPEELVSLSSKFKSHANWTSVSKVVDVYYSIELPFWYMASE